MKHQSFSEKSDSFLSRLCSAYAHWISKKSVFFVLVPPALAMLSWFALLFFGAFLKIKTLTSPTFFLYSLIFFWFLSIMLLTAGMVGLIIKRDEHFLSSRKFSMEQIRGLTWRDFELFNQALFMNLGYNVSIGPGEKADGGIDLEIFKDGKRYFVQCKQYREEKVGVSFARELYGVMARDGADGAFLVTSGEFTQPLLDEFANDPKLELVDGKDLLKKLAEVPRGDEAQDAELDERLAAAFEKLAKSIEAAGSRIVRVPECPRCGAGMVLRQKTGGQSRFWGCENFRSAGCNGLVNLSPDQQAVLAPRMKGKPEAARNGG